MPNFTSYSRCACGAITLRGANTTQTCLSRNKKKYFPGVDLRLLKRDPKDLTPECERCRDDVAVDLAPSGTMSHYML